MCAIIALCKFLYIISLNNSWHLQYLFVYVRKIVNHWFILVLLYLICQLSFKCPHDFRPCLVAKRFHLTHSRKLSISFNDFSVLPFNEVPYSICIRNSQQHICRFKSHFNWWRICPIFTAMSGIIYNLYDSPLLFSFWWHLINNWLCVWKAFSLFLWTSEIHCHRICLSRQLPDI